MQNNIKYLRKRKETYFTQRELADKIGISMTALNLIENGRGANVLTAIKLSRVLNVPVEQIFFE